MRVFELTRTMGEIESITGHEQPMTEFVTSRLKEMGARIELFEVEPGRTNVLGTFGEPRVTLSTHLDTVPPFFPAREDETYIWGRGACDVKGIIAAMLCAAEGLRAQQVDKFGLLLVVGEEKNSAGAYHMANHARGSKHLINGEPTENKLALGSKGALRYEIIAHGRMAHSAYPHLGESATEKLLDALQRVRAVPMPSDPVLGPATLNIGTIAGGRAPNVIPDHAEASVMIRLVNDAAPLRAGVQSACAGLADANEILCIPALHMSALPGLETTVVSYTTDIPAFNGAWGEPHLLGPGTIHVAHTSEERVEKSQLAEAVQIYQRMTRQLLTGF
jgi:acetylornithine deacetylase